MTLLFVSAIFSFVLTYSKPSTIYNTNLRVSTNGIELGRMTKYAEFDLVKSDILSGLLLNNKLTLSLMSSLMPLFSLAYADINLRCSSKKLEALSDVPRLPRSLLTLCIASDNRILSPTNSFLRKY